MNGFAPELIELARQTYEQWTDERLARASDNGESVGLAAVEFHRRRANHHLEECSRISRALADAGLQAEPATPRRGRPPKPRDDEEKGRHE